MKSIPDRNWLDMLDTRDAIALHADARTRSRSRSIRVEIMTMDYLDEENTGHR